MMNRRESIKRLILGTLSAGLFFPSAAEARDMAHADISSGEANTLSAQR